MVSIAGGEPLMHPQIDEIVRQLVARKKIVFLCTNALLLPQEDATSSRRRRYFAWMVHIDGLRERHDESVAKEGVFDEAVEAIKEAKRRGFRVTTNSTFFNTDTPQTIIEVLDYLNDELKVDEMMISPAYAYEKAPDQEHFLRGGADPGAVHEGVRRRQPAAVAAQPLARSSWTSWRARRDFPCTAVGDPELLAASAGSAPAT